MVSKFFGIQKSLVYFHGPSGIESGLVNDLSGCSLARELWKPIGSSIQIVIAKLVTEPVPSLSIPRICAPRKWSHFEETLPQNTTYLRGWPIEQICVKQSARDMAWYSENRDTAKCGVWVGCYCICSESNWSCSNCIRKSWKLKILMQLFCTANEVWQHWLKWWCVQRSEVI